MTIVASTLTYQTCHHRPLTLLTVDPKFIAYSNNITTSVMLTERGFLSNFLMYKQILHMLRQPLSTTETKP